MNKLSKSLAPALGMAALTVLCGSAPAFANNSGIEGELLRMQHEAELAHGEKLLVAWHRHKVSTYRFCIPEQPGDLRLKVLHDGETTEVLDGTCETVSGRHIDIMADSKIPRGEVMALKFERVTT
jgi:hypothetical protein